MDSQREELGGVATASGQEGPEPRPGRGPVSSWLSRKQAAGAWREVRLRSLRSPLRVSHRAGAALFGDGIVSWSNSACTTPG